jgi:type I restriction enzyme, S subunit
MSEIIPEGWSLTTVGRVCDTVYRYPTFYGMETYSNGIPVLRGEHLLNNGKISQNWNDYTYVLEELNNQYPKTKLELGDVVMAVRGTVGKFSKVDKLHVNAQISPNLIRLAPNKDIVDSDFFFQSLFSVKDSLLQVSVSATGVPALNSSDINASLITLPPLPEQKKIASVLTSVDEVIEKTQLQINKLQDLKKGTMNELLTKGIGHKEFKDSELGRIPKSWEVRRFGDVATSIKSGLSRRLSSQDIGIPVINSGNISSRGLNINKLKYWYFDDPQGAKTEDYLLHDGDILLNFINSMGQIGKSCVFEAIGRDCIYTTNLFRIQVGNSIASSFLHYLMTQERFQKEISLIAKPAVNQASFTKDELSNIAVPVPSLFEQDLILRNLGAIEKHITGTYQKLSQIQSLKKSLMQDLLTGKVRVKVN